MDKTILRGFVEAKDVSIIVAEENSESHDATHCSAATIAFHFIHEN